MARQLTIGGQWFDPDTNMVYSDEFGGTPMFTVQNPSQIQLASPNVPATPAPGAPIQGPIMPGETLGTRSGGEPLSARDIEAERSKAREDQERTFRRLIGSDPRYSLMGGTAQNIAMQRFDPLSARYFLSQLPGGVGGQAGLGTETPTFREFVTGLSQPVPGGQIDFQQQMLPTKWKGKDWQNAIGKMVAGGGLPKAIEGYGNMSVQDQLNQRQLFEQNMDGDLSAALDNIGHSEVMSMLQGMIGVPDLPPMVQSWMPGAIRKELNKLELENPGFTDNPKNILLHFAMNGFDINGLGNPPEQEVQPSYTNAQDVTSRNNEIPAKDKSAASTATKSSVDTAQGKEVAKVAESKISDDAKKITPVQNPAMKNITEKAKAGTLTPDTDLLEGFGGEGIPTGIPTPTRAPQTKPLDTPTTPDTGLLPGLGGEGIPTGMPSPVAPPSPIGQAGGGGGTPPITPDTGMLPGLGGEVLGQDLFGIPTTAPAEPLPGIMTGPSALPGGGFGEGGIPSVQQMPGTPGAPGADIIQPLPGTVESGSPLLDPMGISGLTGLPPAGTMTGPTGVDPSIPGAVGIDPLGLQRGGLPYRAPSGYVPSANRTMTDEEYNQWATDKYKQDQRYIPPSPSLTAGPAALPGGGFGEGGIPTAAPTFTQQQLETPGGVSFPSISPANVELTQTTTTEGLERNPFTGEWLIRDTTKTAPVGGNINLANQFPQTPAQSVNPVQPQSPPSFMSLEPGSFADITATQQPTPTPKPQPSLVGNVRPGDLNGAGMGGGYDPNRQMVGTHGFTSTPGVVPTPSKQPYTLSPSMTGGGLDMDAYADSMMGGGMNQPVVVGSYGGAVNQPGVVGTPATPSLVGNVPPGDLNGLGMGGGYNPTRQMIGTSGFTNNAPAVTSIGNQEYRNPLIYTPEMDYGVVPF